MVSTEPAMKRKALGRGLGALIPPSRDTREDDETTAALGSIRPNSWQPRDLFDEKSITSLAASIRQKGILQPLVVRRDGDGYEIISGERRFRAAQRAGLSHVPIVIRQASDAEMLEIALIENLQREDLNPLEEARAYRRMADDLGLKQDVIAERVGKDRSTVANSLRLLQLPQAIQAEIERGTLSAGHARALATAGSPAAMLEIAGKVGAQHLTVRQTEKLARRAAKPAVDRDQQALEERLTKALGTRVRLATRRNGSGRISIDYYSLDQLDGLVQRLTGR